MRDGARHLRETIASLEGQTCGDFEVVAVDDGSTDGTPDLLSDWARRDRRVRVLTQRASGIVAALEAARELARGPYLARMDADDVALPERLGRQLALMEGEPDLTGCGCLVRYFPDEDVRDGARRYEAWLNAAVGPDEIAREIFVECPVAHPTFFLRAGAVEAVGGFADAGWAEDYDLLLRLWEAGGRFAKVPEVLLRWREAPDRLSRTHARYGPDAFRRCKVHYLRRTLLAGDAGFAVWGAGRLGKAFSRELRAAGARLVAFVEVDPRKIGQEIHGAPVLGVGQGLAERSVVHLAAVGQPGAREVIRGHLLGAGFREIRDFVAVA